MAVFWIKMRTNLWDDPRIARICDLTDQSEAAVIGGLYWLWAMADEHTVDGLLHGLTLRAIDRKTGVKGLGEALATVGWLSEDEDGVTIINFDEHNGESAKKRCQTAKRVAKKRNSNADVTQGALQNEDESVTGALARREEKREENKTPATATGAQDFDSIAPANRKPSSGPEKFAMSDNWIPDDQLLNRLQMSGVPQTILTPVNLTEFISYWAAKGDQLTDAEWNHKIFKDLIAKHRRGSHGGTSGAGAQAAGRQKNYQHSRQPTTFERVQLANGINPATNEFFDAECLDGEVVGANATDIRGQVVQPIR